MKKKVKQTYSNFKEYWQNLKPYIKVLYILAWVLFIAEMIYSFYYRTNWHFIIKRFKYPEHVEWNLEYDWDYLYTMILPVIYIIVNCFFLKFKKINKTTLFVLFVLRISYPDTFEIIPNLVLIIMYKWF